METGNRCIVHLDLDTFFVSVERLQNSSLIGKPVIIGGTSDRGVVASCSYEARRFGVHSAMPMKFARILCDHAVVIRGDMDRYSKYSKMVTEIIAERAPVYEKASIDEHYLDITGMDRFFGNLKWSQELRRKIIKETGLPISFGISINKTVSKIATGEAKVMGKNGIVIWKRANGIDMTPVRQYSERKSISTERTFETDTIDVVMLRNLLASMVEKIAFQLRKKQKLTSCVTVKIRYSNFDTHTLQKHIPYTAFDHILIDTALGLFKRLYQRRMLVRLIGVKFSHLVQGSQQLNMFEDTPEMTNLYQAMDRIRVRFGSDAVKRAVV